MKIRYKGAALRDIKQKQDYIGNILHNKQAGQKLTESILCAVSLLADNPSMGVSKQLVFYRIEDETQISVVRILDGQQDYMSILFD